MQGLDTSTTLKELIYMYRGSQVCKSELWDFKKCRATAQGKHGEPAICEAKVSNFLQCHTDSVKISKAKCAEQYAAAFNCMQNNLGENGDSQTGVCSGTLEQFAKCK